MKVLIPKYNYAQADLTKFQNVLRDLNVGNMVTDDAGRRYRKFTESLLYTADDYVPKFIQSSPDIHSGKTWWNRSYKEAVRIEKQM